MSSKKNKIVLAGGSGFLGQALIKNLSPKYDFINFTRKPKNPEDFYWDGKNLGAWTEELEGAQALINLAGRTVNCRYTAKNRAQILDSRLDSTKVLGLAIQQCQAKPKMWLNSSTSTIYEDTRGEKPANTEKTGKVGNDFSMNVAKAWEATFWGIDTGEDIKKVALRTAIVLGKEGGAFPVMRNLAKWGLCSPQGPGNQWISWIHVDDFCRAIDFILAQESEGTYNLCVPNFIQNKDFNHLLKRKLGVWISLPQPTWILKMGAVFIGTETELILKSRKAYPERLLEEGFEFQYPKATQAMDACLS